MGQIEIGLRVEDADKDKAKAVLDKIDTLLQANPDLKLDRFNFSG